MEEPILEVLNSNEFSLNKKQSGNETVFYIQTKKNIWLLPKQIKQFSSLKVALPDNSIGIVSDDGIVNEAVFCNKIHLFNEVVHNSFYGYTTVPIKFYNHSFLPRKIKSGFFIGKLIIISIINCHLLTINEDK